ncbi:hypothetical protein HYR99_24080 [Candidatus Poribacteria bacterium]|nr:hypothetical protein [Candidatus Poribacteria bacterium]
MNPTVTICQSIMILALGILGGFVHIKRPKYRAAQFLAILCFLTCGWIAFEIGTDLFEAGKQLKLALFWRNLSKFFTTYMIATLVCFAWYFPRKSPKIRKKHLTLAYLIALAFAIGAFTPWDAKSAKITNGKLKIEYGWLHDLYFIYMVVCGLYAVGYLLYKYRRFSSPIARLQLQYVTIGLGLSFLTATFFSLILPLFGSTRYFFVGTLAPAMGFFFMAYAIIKYRAMEIDTVIHRTLFWLLMTSLVLLPIYGTLGLIRKWLSTLKTTWEVALVATAFFFLFFAYIRKVQPLIDRLFQRDYYAMRKAIDQLIEEARVLKGSSTLAHQIIHTTQRVMNVPHVTLLCYREPAGEYVLMDGHSEQRTHLTPADAFVRWLARYDAILEREQIELQPQHASIRDLARAYFQQMSAEVCIPFVHVERSETLSIGVEHREIRPFVTLRAGSERNEGTEPAPIHRGSESSKDPRAGEGQLIGALNLGRRAGPRWHFRKREIELLTQLRMAMTLALENALLHETQLELLEKRVQADLIATASGALAHSINNPLGILDGNLDILRGELDSPANESARLAIMEIEVQIHKIEHIVKRMRDAKLGPPELAPCNLNLLIRESLTEVKRSNPNAPVQVNLPGDEIPEILGDVSQLRMALINLIINAYQAMQSGGTLTIHAAASTVQNTPAVQVEIRDTGCGMPEDFIQQVMTRPFHTRKRTGTGLGVWTTKKIIEAHGGVLQLRSQEGVGTTAIIVLPISTSSQ